MSHWRRWIRPGRLEAAPQPHPWIASLTQIHASSPAMLRKASPAVWASSVLVAAALVVFALFPFQASVPQALVEETELPVEILSASLKVHKLVFHFTQKHSFQASGAAPPCGTLCSSLVQDSCLVPHGESPTPLPYFVEWGADPSSAAGVGEQQQAPPPLSSEAEDAEASTVPAIRPWHWSGKAQECGFKHFSREQALTFLRNKHIMFAGDSQVRKTHQALVQLLHPGPAFHYHKRVHYTFDFLQANIRVDYLNEVYPHNLTALFTRLARGGLCPDILALGTGLWHILWVNHPTAFEYAMRTLRNGLLRFLSSEACLKKAAKPSNESFEGAPVRERPSVYWAGFPKLLVHRLNTPRKQKVMTAKCQAAYRAGVSRSGVAASIVSPSSFPAGDPAACRLSSRVKEYIVRGALEEGVSKDWVDNLDMPGPSLDVQIFPLSLACGDHCAMDGMHYNISVYDAAVQTMLNMERRQRDLGLLTIL